MSQAQRQKQFFDFLRKFRANTSETFKGQIISIRPDGNYDVQHSRTGGRLIAAASAGSTYLAPGQLVTVAKPDASLRSTGGEFSIVGVQTTNIRNSSLVQFSNEQSTTAESLTRIVRAGVDVEFVSLTRGGADVPLSVYGDQLSTTATYGDPGITDNVGQSILDIGFGFRLSIDPKASGAMAPGRYALNVAGITIPDFFSVI
jgi:hypothetical protein